ncbi:MAG: glycosyltransferase family 1 protein [Thermodesulfobacteriota bacterium]|nr:glycosyltransferase family 1 protein [Thermodesulfobacteriota bacterium]
MKKILVATDAWHPQINGVVRTLRSTIHVLKEQGYQVRVFSPEGFRTIPCPTYSEIRLSLVGKRSALGILQEFLPDAVHIATEGPIGWAMWRACRSLGKPFTTSYHTRFPEYIRMRIPIPLWASYKVVHSFHSSAVRTMVATQGLEDDLRSHKFSNLARWSRGVDTELFKPGDKNYLSSERPLAMFVGRVAVEKNIEAFLKLDMPGSKYVVGDGPAMKSLQKKYPEVTFTGAKHGKELAQHVAAADVFVFPSLTDTFGVVLLEAMACGVPVAAFPVTGPKDIVRNGVNGWMSDDLKEAIIKSLDVPSHGCLEFARKYSWERCSAQFRDNLEFQAS